VKAIFHAALDRPPAERSAFVRAEADGDSSVAAEVESLLQSHAESNTLLEHSAAALLGMTGNATLPLRIGPYRVLHEIGRGGMGAVYLAIRDDDTYKKEVAIKIIGAGVVTEAAIKRFRHERQILANLDHPNIARLLDGGSTHDGLPYVVMEYVDGVPIDRFAVEGELSVDDRLRLFVQVGAAVHYAHQHLVVHRDLKSGNILVTADGVPKLLDFGIAKLLDADLVALADVTVTGGRMLTPECASPEQILGQPMTTASDVYALGVLLQRLLTGRGPYAAGLTAPHDLARAICEEPPRPPSETADDHAVAERLRGDLDTIVLKALQKDPARRYTSVEQLAADVERHLGGRPVLARPDTIRYRTAKFVSRHRAGAAAAMLVFASLIGGIAATAWEAHVARLQRNRAERRFDDVPQLANSFLFEFNDAIENLAGATAARALVVSKALSYLDSLSQEAAGDVSLQRELATAYERIGDIQGGRRAANIGRSAEARKSQERALAIREALVRAAPSDPRLVRELGASYERVAGALFVAGDMDGAARIAGKNVAVQERLAAIAGGDAARLAVATSYVTEGYMLAAHREIERGAAECRRGLAILAQLSGANPADRGLQLQVARATGYLGEILAASQPDESVAAYREVGKIVERLASGHDNDFDLQHRVMGSYQGLGETEEGAGKFAEALAGYRAAEASARRLSESDRANVESRSELSSISCEMGGMLAATGHPQDAYELVRKSRGIAQELVSADARNIVRQARMAICDMEMGRVYAGLATDGGTVAMRRRLWRSARASFEASRQFWQRAPSAGLEAEWPGKLTRDIERCDEALTALEPAHSPSSR